MQGEGLHASIEGIPTIKVRDLLSTFCIPKKVSVATACALLAATASPPGRTQTLSETDRGMAHDIFKQLIETNTTHSTGSTAAAAEAMRDRLLKAGFPAGDMEIVGPRDKRLNLVVRYRAAKGAVGKPVLFICHLDVVEANRSDWTMDPFQLNEKDGFFYGRGAQDVKNSDDAL